MEETQAVDTVRRKMSLRLIWDGQIPIQQQRMDSLISSFWKSLEYIGVTAGETFQNLGKTRQEAKRMAKMDAIAARKARVAELRRSVQEQRANRDQ